MSTTPLTTDPLLAWRARFPSVEGVLHFASHTLGAMPAEVESSLVEYAQAWSTRGVPSVGGALGAHPGRGRGLDASV
jgi:kynureninase